MQTQKAFSLLHEVRLEYLPCAYPKVLDNSVWIFLFPLPIT
jgi:hypothetical protein